MYVLNWSPTWFDYKSNMTWLCNLGLHTQKTIQRRWQSCRSKTKEKDISSGFPGIRSFVSLAAQYKQLKLWGRLHEAALCTCNDHRYTPTSFRVQITSPLSVTPHTTWATAAAQTQGCQPEGNPGRHLKGQVCRGDEHVPEVFPNLPCEPTFICAVSAVLLPKGYGLNVYAPHPQFICWSPDKPQCDGIGR